MRIRGSWGWGSFLLCLAVISCLPRPQPKPRQAKPQAWAEGRGPVVPHDTFPADCSLCHQGGNWHEIRRDFTFNHEKETGTALRGAHADAECLRCHNDRGPVGLFAKRGCAGCHEDIHRGRIGTDCASCHSEADWTPVGVVAMHNRTRFPLTGAHAAVACFRCHPAAEAGEFVGALPRCESCHQTELAAARKPDHGVMGLTAGCQNCHNGVSWAGGVFTHAGIAGGCAACHMAEYNATTAPNHAATSVPTTCENCHSSTSWRGAPFSHTGITSGCVTCHMPDYNAATNPNHAAMGIATTCEICHGTTTWLGAAFSHVGIASGCATCHMPEYNATTNPDHAAAGFPTTCETCHSTTTWLGATFQHTFVITSGPHKRSCQECHRAPGDYSIVSCTHCHGRTQMDSKHRGVSGYTWSSSACISCHPRGR
ncbi:MAG: hypothetical protein HYY16_13840 [Planctomycetes bacterium]|nr:hypothetical protein [Planctomycetota bacterium]